MSRVLICLNLLGVMALAVLCAVQWRINQRVNLEAIALDKTRLEHVAKISEQERAIQGYSADLEELRGRLTLSEAQQKQTEEKLLAMTHERNQLAAQRDQLIAQRDQLKATLDKWIAAVAERDAALKQAGAEVQKIANERNDAVVKFNELAGKYNLLVKDLDEARAKLASSH